MIKSGPSHLQHAPQIFDTRLVTRRKRRALKASQMPGARDGSFLLDHAANDLIERLNAVERSFVSVLDLSDDDGRTASKLKQNTRVQTVTRLVSHHELGNASHHPFVVAASDHLPVQPGALDLAVSVLNLHTINDVPGLLVQVRRALKPDGLLLGALLGGNSLHELRDVLASEEDEARGGTTPRVAPFIDVRDLGGLLQRAGFALPVTDVDTLTARYDSLFDLMADLRAMGATNALVQRTRKPWTKARALRAAQLYAERHADPDGRVRATFQILSFSGWAPAETQQQPLRPGSAQSRLADALGTTEIPTRPPTHQDPKKAGSSDD